MCHHDLDIHKEVATIRTMYEDVKADIEGKSDRWKRATSFSFRPWT